eukprot:TRINITY_DN23665_c0_g1_i2.p1 TRINITY_DN23665_c0_g1~~TRINITY_DN23665_c0_g1_i2.p1  ORF type:complete len:231 (+),score=64.55 TRINITY_DN23665_c0_g1_i2:92-694(+)
MSQDVQLSKISRAVSCNSSISVDDRDDDGMESNISQADSLDRAKTNNAVTIIQEVPVVKMPSLFHPFPPTSVTSKPTVEDTSLPAPLLPENIDPTVLIPELQPRNPAPYSSGSSSEAAMLECPMCDENFAGGCQELLEKHVDQHLDNVVECPICGKTYDKKNQLVYEEHVQDHFKDQVPVDTELPLNMTSVVRMCQSFFE